MDDIQAPAPAAEEAIAQDTPQGAPQVDDAPPDEQSGEQPEKAKDDKPKRSKNPREALEKAFAADVEAKPDGKAEAKADAKADMKPEGKADDKAEKPAEKPQEAKADEKDGDKPEAKAAHHAPPSRFSADAKAEWEKAPESIRAETHRALRELEKGIEKKDAMIKPIEPFMKMAEQHGTTVDKALENYVNMENMLRQNPAQGLRALAQNMGMTPQQMAAALTGQQGQQGQQGQPDPRDQQFMAMQRELQQMKSQFGEVSQTVQQQRENAVLQSVEQFAAQHPRFDELSPEIARLLETGYAEDLEDAYTKAERLNPAPPAPVQPATAPPAQTRQARSLTGAPSPGSNPATARTPSKSPREALKKAFGA